MADNRPTKKLKYGDSGDRGAASKRSRAENEEEGEEVDLQSPATKVQRRLHQEAPFSEPDSGVGSSLNCEGSSSSKKKFEVFISHRGPDTKHTLAYHMYDLLCDRGVEVFLDKEELQSGERFPLAIEEAIKCSTVDVCILSSGFAESVWCLKELEIMVNKYEMGRSKLIPIFYDVKPCDVRHLQGAFGQGFQTKIIEKNRYPTQLIDKWRQSLRKIADITGEEGKGECCKAIFFLFTAILSRQNDTKKDALMNLRQLILSNCMNLKRLPDFMATFRHLSSIKLNDCTSLESIPDSFDQLQALQHLQLMGCFKIKALPESFDATGVASDAAGNGSSDAAADQTEAATAKRGAASRKQ